METSSDKSQVMAAGHGKHTSTIYQQGTAERDKEFLSTYLSTTEMKMATWTAAVANG